MPLDATSLGGPEGLRGLIACPECDALFRAAGVDAGHRAVCARCGATLIAPRRRAGTAIIALALASLVLVGGALWFPFLRIDAMLGSPNSSSSSSKPSASSPSSSSSSAFQAASEVDKKLLYVGR